MLLDKTYFVSRLEKNPTSVNKESYVAHSGFRGPGGIISSAIRANVQPASAEMIALSEGVVGKLFTGFTVASGVVETMKLTRSGVANEEYIVRGRQKFDYGIQTHYELVLDRPGNQR